MQNQNFSEHIYNSFNRWFNNNNDYEFIIFFSSILYVLVCGVCEQMSYVYLDVVNFTYSLNNIIIMIIIYLSHYTVEHFHNFPFLDFDFPFTL